MFPVHTKSTCFWSDIAAELVGSESIRQTEVSRRLNRFGSPHLRLPFRAVWFFSTNVLDDLEHIGARLKAARQTAGLSVEDVSFRTQLPRSVLLALEGEDFSAFASPVYAKSFLAQYSDFLNVDAHPWLDAIEPGSFVAGDQLGRLVEAPEFPLAEKSIDVERRGGGWSVLGLLALSTAMVFAAIQGYKFFEVRFADETRPPSIDSVPAVMPIPRVSERSFGRKPGVEREDEELSNAPPRAIIVR